MKKIFMILIAAFCLAASGTWAQDAQAHAGKRTHTRPPYSGPRKGSAKSHPRPSPNGKKTGRFKKGSSSHIVVR